MWGRLLMADAQADMVARTKQQDFLVAGAQPLVVVGKMPAEAVAAVDGALAGYNQQGPAAVLPDQPGGFNGTFFNQGVAHEAGHLSGFLVQGKHLP